MLNRNILFPSLIMVLSLVILFLIGQFDEPRFQDASVNAKFFPTIIAIGQIIICIALIIQQKIKPAFNQGAITSKMALIGILFLIGYAFLISLIGYLYASLLSFTIYLIGFKVKNLLYYVVAWSFVFVIYYLFGEVFYIALPQGIFY